MQNQSNAGVAQLAERELPKLEVMGSTPTARCFENSFGAQVRHCKRKRTLTYISTLRSRFFVIPSCASKIIVSKRRLAFFGHSTATSKKIRALTKILFHNVPQAETSAPTSEPLRTDKGFSVKKLIKIFARNLTRNDFQNRRTF